MNIKNGLTTKEVEESIRKYGTNELEEKNNNSFFKLLLESLGDPIIKILLIALGIKVQYQNMVVKEHLKDYKKKHLKQNVE